MDSRSEYSRGLELPVTDVDILVAASGELDIVRRDGEDRWAHLSLCVLDAVSRSGPGTPV